MGWNFGENFLQGIQDVTNSAGGAIIGAVGEKVSSLIGGPGKQPGGNLTAAQIEAGQTGTPPQMSIPGTGFSFNPEILKYAALAVGAIFVFKFFKKGR